MRILNLLVILVLSSAEGFASEESAANYYVGQGELADLSLELSDGQTVTIHATYKETNEPLTQAKIALQPASDSSKNIEFQETKEPGVYSGKLDDKSYLPGQIIIQTESDADAVELAAPKYKNALAAGAVKDAHGLNWKGVGLGFILGVLSIILGFFGFRYIKLRRSQASGLILLPILLSSPIRCTETAYAHGGHDHGGPSPQDAMEGSGSEIILPKASQLLIGLKTTAAKKEGAFDSIKSFGHVIPKPQYDAVIIAPQAGFLKSSQTTILGKRVKKGDTLGFIQSVSQIRLESPIDGEVSEVHASDGARIEGGGKIFRVTDSSVLWVDAELFSSQLSKVKAAKNAFITMEDKTSYQAKILSQMTPISEETRTAKVFLEIINQETKPKIGSFVEVVFSIPGNQEGFLVPNSSVLNKSGEQVVFVKTGPETFVSKLVTTTEGSVPGKTLVTKGLAEGDLVVTSGNYQLMMKAK